MRDQSLSDDLLHWYDVNARALPWRVGPQDRMAGILPDPYLVWLSEIMLQQTTVATVSAYFQRFVQLWPTIDELAAADNDRVLGEWAGLGYYARARNLMKCARVVAADYDGKFPENYEELLKLPGVGPYTAAAIASIAFNKRTTVVDGNVERVISRLHCVDTPLPTAKKELTTLAETLTPTDRPGDYAQAIMDLGATICRPKNPDCGACPWTGNCLAQRNNNQTDYPKKAPKKQKPTRCGTVYIARREDGAWLLERRPEKGLLGGMLGWPGTEWAEQTVCTPPFSADWSESETQVRHTFTHFHLTLKIMYTKLPTEIEPPVGFFVSHNEFQRSDLPTVMRKAYDVVSAQNQIIELSH